MTATFKEGKIFYLQISVKFYEIPKDQRSQIYRSNLKDKSSVEHTSTNLTDR